MREPLRQRPLRDLRRRSPGRCPAAPTRARACSRPASVHSVSVVERRAGGRWRRRRRRRARSSPARSSVPTTGGAVRTVVRSGRPVATSVCSVVAAAWRPRSRRARRAPRARARRAAGQSGFAASRSRRRSERVGARSGGPHSRQYSPPASGAPQRGHDRSRPARSLRAPARRTGRSGRRSGAACRSGRSGRRCGPRLVRAARSRSTSRTRSSSATISAACSCTTSCRNVVLPVHLEHRARRGRGCALAVAEQRAPLAAQPARRRQVATTRRRGRLSVSVLGRALALEERRHPAATLAAPSARRFAQSSITTSRSSVSSRTA